MFLESIIDSKLFVKLVNLEAAKTPNLRLYCYYDGVLYKGIVHSAKILDGTKDVTIEYRKWSDNLRGYKPAFFSIDEKDISLFYIGKDYEGRKALLCHDADKLGKDDEKSHRKMKVTEIFESGGHHSVVRKISAPNLGPSGTWKEKPAFVKAAIMNAADIKRQVDAANSDGERFIILAKAYKITGTSSERAAIVTSYHSDDSAKYQGLDGRLFIKTVNAKSGQVIAYKTGNKEVTFNVKDLKLDSQHRNQVGSVARTWKFVIDSSKVTPTGEIHKPEEKKQPKENPYSPSTWKRA